MDGGAWWATVHGVAKSWTWLSDFTVTFRLHALEKEMATHSSVLAWRIPGTGEPGGLPSMGSHRVRHDWSDLAAAAAVVTKSPPDYPGWSHLEILNLRLFQIWPHSQVLGARLWGYFGEGTVQPATISFCWSCIFPTLLYLEKSFKSPLWWHLQYETLPELHYQIDSLTTPLGLYTVLCSCVQHLFPQ